MIIYASLYAVYWILFMQLTVLGYPTILMNKHLIGQPRLPLMLFDDKLCYIIKISQPDISLSNICSNATTNVINSGDHQPTKWISMSSEESQAWQLLESSLALTGLMFKTVDEVTDIFTHLIKGDGRSVVHWSIFLILLTRRKKGLTLYVMDVIRQTETTFIPLKCSNII